MFYLMLVITFSAFFNPDRSCHNPCCPAGTTRTVLQPCATQHDNCVTKLANFAETGCHIALYRCFIHAMLLSLW